MLSRIYSLTSVLNVLKNKIRYLTLKFGHTSNYIDTAKKLLFLD